MNWTKEERELIALLDRFVARYAESEQFQDGSFYPQILRILATTKGNLQVTEQYCEELLATGSISLVSSEPQPASPPELITPEPAARPNRQQSRMHYTKKFNPWWTVLFSLVALGTVFFIAKKSPSTSSVTTYQNAALLCSAGVVEAAQKALEQREESFLQEAIASIEETKAEQAGRIDTRCQQLLWETQFIYAIDFLASSGKQKQAVTYLCRIAPQFFQYKDVLPWFARWSNTNSDFAQWLEQYKQTNSCAIAPYLE